MPEGSLKLLEVVSLTFLAQAASVRELVDNELGFQQGVLTSAAHTRTYLFVAQEKIVGCLIAEPVQKVSCFHSWPSGKLVESMPVVQEQACAGAADCSVGCKLLDLCVSCLGEQLAVPTVLIWGIGNPLWTVSEEECVAVNKQLSLEAHQTFTNVQWQAPPLAISGIQKAPKHNSENRPRRRNTTTTTTTTACAKKPQAIFGSLKWTRAAFWDGLVALSPSLPLLSASLSFFLRLSVCFPSQLPRSLLQKPRWSITGPGAAPQSQRRWSVESVESGCSA